MSGEIRYIRIYTSWKEETAKLTSAEKGRLIDSLIDYAITGKEKEPEGNERFIYPGLMQRIRREAETHERKKQQRREEREK